MSSSSLLDYLLSGHIIGHLFQGRDHILLDAELGVMLDELDVSLHDAAVCDVDRPCCVKDYYACHAEQGVIPPTMPVSYHDSILLDDSYN